jgi:ankyrin repeat protein
VEAGADLRGKGWGPLHYAAFAGQTEILQFLVGKGAALDARAPNGQTALMLAAKNGHKEAVKLLIDADADMDLNDPDGNTAISLARSSGNSDIADYLRSEGAHE